jgi:hypothetical protein
MRLIYSSSSTSFWSTTTGVLSLSSLEEVAGLSPIRATYYARISITSIVSNRLRIRGERLELLKEYQVVY